MRQQQRMVGQDQSVPGDRLTHQVGVRGDWCRRGRLVVAVRALRQRLQPDRKGRACVVREERGHVHRVHRVRRPHLFPVTGRQQLQEQEDGQLTECEPVQEPVAGSDPGPPAGCEGGRVGQGSQQPPQRQPVAGALDHVRGRQQAGDGVVQDGHVLRQLCLQLLGVRRDDRRPIRVAGQPVQCGGQHGQGLPGAGGRLQQAACAGVGPGVQDGRHLLLCGPAGRAAAVHAGGEGDRVDPPGRAAQRLPHRQ